MEYLEIGAVPCDEKCESLGPNYDQQKAIKECRVFIEQLRRTFGEEPVGARLRIKSNPHDFGTYHEVVCYYEDNNEDAFLYALKCEGHTPANWDKEARKELGLI